MSGETVPLLCHAVPAAEVLKRQWTLLKDSLDYLDEAIHAGLESLNGFLNRAAAIPAYVICMCMS